MAASLIIAVDQVQMCVVGVNGLNKDTRVGLCIDEFSRMVMMRMHLRISTQ